MELKVGSSIREYLGYVVIEKSFLSCLLSFILRLFGTWLMVHLVALARQHSWLIVHLVALLVHLVALARQHSWRSDFIFFSPK